MVNNLYTRTGQQCSVSSQLEHALRQSVCSAGITSCASHGQRCATSVATMCVAMSQVHDPLLEAGKAKWNKQQAKLKKRGTEWAKGGPLT